jgi:hypothetical protein
MEDTGGGGDNCQTENKLPLSPPELENIIVMQRFFHVCSGMKRVPTKQTIWTLKLQFTDRFQCWDEKHLALHVPVLKKQWNSRSGNKVQLK